MALFPFDNRYARLPERFYARRDPTPVRDPALVRLNRPLAEELGLDADALSTARGASVLAGNLVPHGAEPIAQAYAGHQFGNFVPQLGDGRAILLGEVLDTGGVRRDIQLKGSGPTPFSRRGDGRAALGPVLREYLVSEAMHALGIPTTRSLAAVTTGEVIARERLLPGAVLTRVAASHVRVGTFQYFAARRDAEALGALVDFVAERHYPEAVTADSPALALLHAVGERQAELVARWLGVGFIHGVMNTDNTTVSGETIDYGPCAFMDSFDAATVFSSIDHQGRYAYGAQPQIIGWNLARLGEALIPVIHPEPKVALGQVQAAIDRFSERMEAAWLEVMREKLGMASERDGDRALVTEFLYAMQAGKADFTNTCRALCDAAGEPGRDETVRAEFEDAARYDAWAVKWRARLGEDDLPPEARRVRMQRANPWVIPRNHRVEAALAAAEQGDLAPFDELVSVLSTPYEAQPERVQYREPAPPSDEAYHTFCGT